MSSILLFEDKLGITTGYESIWQSLLMSSGLTGVEINRRNSFRSLASKVQLLTRKGNRVSPGFNPDPKVQSIVATWVRTQIKVLNPNLVLTCDPVMLFMLNPDWDQATIDKLRGGVYKILDVPVLVTLPISAWHTQKKESDIARMNEGFTNEAEWEEDHGGEEADNELNHIWIEPVVVPFGRFVLRADLMKAKRILERLKQ